METVKRNITYCLFFQVFQLYGIFIYSRWWQHNEAFLTKTPWKRDVTKKLSLQFIKFRVNGHSSIFQNPPYKRFSKYYRTVAVRSISYDESYFKKRQGPSLRSCCYTAFNLYWKKMVIFTSNHFSSVKVLNSAVCESRLNDDVLGKL